MGTCSKSRQDGSDSDFRSLSQTCSRVRSVHIRYILSWREVRYCDMEVLIHLVFFFCLWICVYIGQRAWNGSKIKLMTWHKPSYISKNVQTNQCRSIFLSSCTKGFSTPFFEGVNRFFLLIINACLLYRSYGLVNITKWLKRYIYLYTCTQDSFFGLSTY